MHPRRGLPGAILVLGLLATQVAAAPPGSLMGMVRLDGPAPVRAPLAVYKWHQVCGETIPDERLVLGGSGGLRYVVVTIEGVSGDAKPRSDLIASLDNFGCRFVPHVQTAEVGQVLELRNSDPILHNADTRVGRDTLFNIALPPGRSARKTLDRAGLVDVTCDVRHTWMKAYIAVTDHPYHTVTDAYGDYEIRDVPPGRYTVKLWHEELGTLERPVTIEAGKATNLDVTYAAPAPQQPK